MSDPLLSAKRVPDPWRSEWWPACRSGHALMDKAVDRDGYVCPDCDWFLGSKDWMEYLHRQGDLP